MVFMDIPIKLILGLSRVCVFMSWIESIRSDTYTLMTNTHHTVRQSYGNNHPGNQLLGSTGHLGNHSYMVSPILL
jgi:hypothetical protein